jgi:hypothetical protein
MRFLFFIVSFFTILSVLQSAEIVLANGDAFIADILTENSETVSIQWKGKIFSIPRSEIQSIDKDKVGEHIAYKYNSFRLKDGSTIRGILLKLDVTTLVIKTELGILTIEKSKLEDSGASIPKEYENINPVAKKSVLGIGLNAYSFRKNIQEEIAVLSGGNFFIEPSFLYWKEKYRLGYKVEYLGTSYNILTHSVYFQYRYYHSELLDFYINIGPGASFVSYQEGRKKVTGLDPSIYTEIGWQGIKFQKVVVRLGFSNYYLYEQNGGPGLLGFNLSLGINL